MTPQPEVVTTRESQFMSLLLILSLIAFTGVWITLFLVSVTVMADGPEAHTLRYGSLVVLAVIVPALVVPRAFSTPFMSG